MKTYTTTLTSKGQFTIPKPIRDRLAVQKGTKFQIIYSQNGFTARPKTRPRILDLAGSLKQYDDGTQTDIAIEKAFELRAIEIANE
ncbi:AbrB family transcriptional regulator [Candidatus Berkelbacteria bacterium CG06_land_8_20_14_3_00_43_10]|uniref:AbrB family transcriptional regulator n=1 Tax=Candidatus Berkelbacteria bacterium CG10_big_fil_rev_8_21_14_0_10_43_14 TaxID=1974515 RepID=A0A2M6R947_9BACT|nr:MAG: hypothetical protein AUK41_00435 [Candidatus Berkelbacteria bacterium CG2_30_43_20]PIS07049.1 MAG: AbrB family transcriptional regulator [Candidatus Berkelbacteria bacterium CG10_big_fil_rev_8_21_14_0_10_43_14]PIU87247.1 MAG: AbrB family transcriptional regulator [Candidatus Berkelbacteria bacterium CG06_land_8_20_14_3_00_43_10]